MTSSSLWLEITLAGFVLLCALLFPILMILGINDLGFLTGLDAFLPYIAVGMVGFSYLLGILFHRLLQMAASASNDRWRWAFGLMGPGEPWSEHFRNSVLIWQRGSERLHKEMDLQFGMLALFRAVAVAFPLLGVTAALWLLKTAWQGGSLLVLVLCVVLGVGFFLANQRQRRQYRELREQAVKELQGAANIMKRTKRPS